MADSERRIAVGIDIGGTNIKIGLVDEDGVIVHRFALKTGDYPDPRSLVDDLYIQLEPLIAKMNLVGVGIGAPNGNFYRGTIEHAPNLTWEGVVPLASWISEKMGAPCLLTNDANAAALGEMLFGAARGKTNFLLITLGTGLGSGIVVNGELVYGHDGAAGEIGHVIVEPDGRPCGCGRHGCLEQYVSAPGLVYTYQKLNPDAPPGLESQEIAEKAREGEQIALNAFELTGKRLGLALANSVAYTQPETIYLFGGVASAGNLLLEPTRCHFMAHLLNVYQGKTDLQLSALSENTAAILGAASLIWASHE